MSEKIRKINYIRKLTFPRSNVKKFLNSKNGRVHAPILKLYMKTRSMPKLHIFEKFYWECLRPIIFQYFLIRFIFSLTPFWFFTDTFTDGNEVNIELKLTTTIFLENFYPTLRDIGICYRIFGLLFTMSTM